MRRVVVIGLSIIVFLTALPASAKDPRAEDHLVSLSTMQSRLSDAVTQREADLAEVESVFASPEAVAVAAQVGVDAQSVSERVAILSNEELQDFAQRAALLRADPVPGGTVKSSPLVLLALLIILIVVVLVSIHHQSIPEEGTELRGVAPVRRGQA